MAPNFQSSFIPKEPVTEKVFKPKKAGMLGVLAVSLFITSLVVWGGVFFYKKSLKSEIQDLKINLAESEKNLDKQAINELSDFSRKLDITKSLILKHVVVSNFIDILASSTVSSVRFKSFGYDYAGNGSLSVKLQGEAANYAAVALQENVYSQNKNLKSVAFSNLNLGEKGLVTFDLAMTVDPKISIYSP